ncbi:MAG: UDP-glucose 4-epimerase GalE [Gammaproteobacteria bacterium]|nr:UDP-glucose 4-epimerase GalE [Gammaproteobacteria bacterium]
MKVLVTGGTGYIGSHTCVALQAAGHEITIADNLSNSSPEALARIARISGTRPGFQALDMRDAPGLEKLFDAQCFDAIMHFAGVKAVAESVADPLKYYSNNVMGSIALFDSALRHGVTRLVFSSSATVYGENSRSPIREDAPVAPVNPYGRSKHMVEEILTEMCRANAGLRVMALRYFNPVGAHPSGLVGEAPVGTPNNLMPYLCQVAAGRLEELTVFGTDYPTPDGTAVRDYIHVMDLAEGHLRALEFLESHGGMHLVNLGTGRGTSVLEMLTAFQRVNQVPIPHRFGARRPGDTKETFADVALADRVLGWRTQYSLDDMCRDAWRWQKMNPKGYE